MAKEQAIYEVVDDFSSIAEKLIDLNSDRWGHIDGKALRMVVITNKERPDEPLAHKVIKVGNPVAMFCEFRYIVVSWKQVWEECDDNQKAKMIVKVLESLEPDENEPKIKAPDEKNFKSLLRTFGVDFEENPKITGLLEKPIEWADAPVFGEDVKLDDTKEGDGE